MIRGMILLAAMALVAAVAAVAAADTVYLRGKTIEGKVTRDGEKVIIDLTDGSRVEVDAKDVLYVYQPPVIPGAVSSSSPAATAPAAQISLPGAAPAVKPGSAPAAGFGSIDVADVTLPESMVFATMRSLAAAGAGMESFDLRKKLEDWRAAVHDRKRKVGPTWLTPKDFIHRREAFDEALKEAADLAKKAKGKPNVKDLMPGVYAKLRTGALAWADPPLRNFLMGLAEYQAGSFLPAYTLFQQCHKDAPYIPAFAQGEAMSLLDMDRAGDALAAAMDFMHLRDDSFEACDLLRQVTAKVPGADTHSPAFTAAKDLLAMYQLPANAPVAKSVNWLMPGKAWTARDDTTLPVPPYDRLIVRQALAVPVADNLLIVDASVVTDAAEVFVRIDSRTIAQAFVKKLTLAGPKPTAVSPLAILTLSSYSFTPAKRDEGPESVKDKDVAVWGMGMYPELGAGPRQGKARVRILDSGEVKLSSALMPGEATAPAITETNQLMCFITGRMDVGVENGGDEKVVTLGEIGQLVKAAKGTSGGFVAAGKVKRVGAPTPVKGNMFIVFGLFPEKFQDK